MQILKALSVLAGFALRGKTRVSVVALGRKGKRSRAFLISTSGWPISERGQAAALERDRSFIRRLGRQARRSEQTRQAARQRGRGRQEALIYLHMELPQFLTSSAPTSALCTTRLPGCVTREPEPHGPPQSHPQLRWTGPMEETAAPKALSPCSIARGMQQGCIPSARDLGSACSPQHVGHAIRPYAIMCLLAPMQTLSPWHAGLWGAGEKETTLAADRATAGVHVRPWQVHASPGQVHASPWLFITCPMSSAEKDGVKKVTRP